jgi:hypothetical protein
MEIANADVHELPFAISIFWQREEVEREVRKERECRLE